MPRDKQYYEDLFEDTVALHTTNEQKTLRVFHDNLKKVVSTALRAIGTVDSTPQSNLVETLFISAWNIIPEGQYVSKGLTMLDSSQYGPANARGLYWMFNLGYYIDKPVAIFCHQAVIYHRATIIKDTLEQANLDSTLVNLKTKAKVLIDNFIGAPNKLSPAHEALISELMVQLMQGLNEAFHTNKQGDLEREQLGDYLAQRLIVVNPVPPVNFGFAGQFNQLPYMQRYPIALDALLLAQLAYEDKAIIESYATKWGYNLTERYSFHYQYKSNNRSIILANDDSVICLFRGSPSLLRDIFIRLNMIPTVSEAAVHREFANALDELWNETEGLGDVLSYHAKLTPKRFVFIGHSVGGALALLAAARFQKLYEQHQNKIAVFTFAQPRATAALSNDLSQNVCRFTHPNDPIPHVIPESSGYVHVGTEYSLPDVTQIFNWEDKCPIFDIKTIKREVHQLSVYRARLMEHVRGNSPEDFQRYFQPDANSLTDKTQPKELLAGVDVKVATDIVDDSRKSDLSSSPLVAVRTEIFSGEDSSALRLLPGQPPSSQSLLVYQERLMTHAKKYHPANDSADQHVLANDSVVPEEELVELNNITGMGTLCLTKKSNIPHFMRARQTLGRRGLFTTENIKAMLQQMNNIVHFANALEAVEIYLDKDVFDFLVETSWTGERSELLQRFAAIIVILKSSEYSKETFNIINIITFIFNGIDIKEHWERLSTVITNLPQEQSRKFVNALGVNKSIIQKLKADVIANNTPIALGDAFRFVSAQGQEELIMALGAQKIQSLVTNIDELIWLIAKISRWSILIESLGSHFYQLMQDDNGDLDINKLSNLLKVMNEEDRALFVPVFIKTLGLERFKGLNRSTYFFLLLQVKKNRNMILEYGLNVPIDLVQSYETAISVMEKKCLAIENYEKLNHSLVALINASRPSYQIFLWVNIFYNFDYLNAIINKKFDDDIWRYISLLLSGIGYDRQKLIETLGISSELIEKCKENTENELSLSAEMMILSGTDEQHQLINILDAQTIRNNIKDAKRLFEILYYRIQPECDFTSKLTRIKLLNKLGSEYLRSMQRPLETVMQEYLSTVYDSVLTMWVESIRGIFSYCSGDSYKRYIIKYPLNEKGLINIYQLFLDIAGMNALWSGHWMASGNVAQEIVMEIDQYKTTHNADMDINQIRTLLQSKLVDISERQRNAQSSSYFNRPPSLSSSEVVMRILFCLEVIQDSLDNKLRLTSAVTAEGTEMYALKK